MENKGYPEVNLDSWIKVGEGGNGVTYEHPDKPEHGDFDREAARFGAVDIVSRIAYVPPTLPEKIYFRILLGSLMKFF